MPDNEAWPNTQATTETIDDSDAHSVWCQCDECVEIVMIDMFEDKVNMSKL